MIQGTLPPQGKYFVLFRTSNLYNSFFSVSERKSAIFPLSSGAYDMFHEFVFGCKSMLDVPDFIFCLKSVFDLPDKVSAHITKVTKYRYCVCKELVTLVVGIHETVYNLCLHWVISYINKTMVFREKIGKYRSFCHQVYYEDSIVACCLSVIWSDFVGFCFYKCIAVYVLSLRTTIKPNT